MPYFRRLYGCSLLFRRCRFYFGITLACENVGVDRYVYPILSPCLRGTSDESNDVAEGVTVGAGFACPSTRDVFVRAGRPRPYGYTKKDTQNWMSFSIKVAMTYSPTKRNVVEVRRWRRREVARSTDKVRAGRVAKWTPSPGEEGIDACIYKKRHPKLDVFFYKSGDDLLSHQAERSGGSSMAAARGRT